MNREESPYYDQEFQNSNLLDEIKFNNHKDFWLTEYQCIISQFTKYIGLYFLVFIVYLGIQGFLLIGFSTSVKYFKPISTLLLIFSIVCSLLFFYCLLVATAIVQRLSTRKEKALKELKIEEKVGDEFSIGTSTTYVFFIFNIGLLVIITKLFLEITW